MKRSLCIVAVALALLTSCGPQPPQKRGYVMPQQSKAPMMEPAETVMPKGLIPTNAPSIKVALLLPLSGESVAIGNAMLDAATMALYDHYLSVPSENIKSQIILLPKDTGNTPAEAARAAKSAIEQGATFIVGPLFSQSVSVVAPIAREHNVPMLTFSNNRAVASSSVFVFGFLPEQQINRVAEYAFLHNYQRVAMLAPNDAYGQKIEAALIDVYNQKGGAVAPAELYAPSPANIDAAVARLAAFNNANQDRRFQAIFVADGGYQLKNIINSIKKTNIDLTKIKLLGTGLWDDPEITKIPEMNGAMFSSSPPDAYKNFERRFTTMYGYKPLRLVSLSYDALTILIKITMGDPSGRVNLDALTDPHGFADTANGLMRLRPDGPSERRLAIMEVTPGGFQVVEPAPKSFEEPGKQGVSMPAPLPPLPTEEGRE